MLRAGGVTNKGPVRAINEDSLGVDASLQLVVVADGMGGANAGEVASRMAVERITQSMRAPMDPATPDNWPLDPGLSEMGNRLRAAVCEANDRILEAASSSDEMTGMGTTVVAAIADEGRLSVAHVGDSRLYVFDGRLRLLTSDDSWVATVLAQLPESGARLHDHPLSNALTNVVGVYPGVDVHVAEETLYGGEWIVLTTDGVHGVLEDGEIATIVAEIGVQDAPGAVATALVDAALAHGSRDNCTALVARYEA